MPCYTNFVYFAEKRRKTKMVDTKKEQEREELHRAIWAIADELRGAVDGWDFKNYVLGTMLGYSRRAGESRIPRRGFSSSPSPERICRVPDGRFST